jgi:hypothetical protein
MASILRALKSLIPKIDKQKELKFSEPSTPVKPVQRPQITYQYVTPKNTCSPPRFNISRKLFSAKKLTRKLYINKKSKNDQVSPLHLPTEQTIKIHDDELQTTETPYFKKNLTIAARSSPGASPQSMRIRALMSPSHAHTIADRPQCDSLTRVSRRLDTIFLAEESSTEPRQSISAKELANIIAESEIELSHDDTYHLIFAGQNKLLTLCESNKVSLQSPVQDKIQKSRQEWRYTEDGLIQSCMDPSIVLEIRNSVVQCNKRVGNNASESDDIVSQAFDILYIDPASCTAEKYICLQRNRKMMLGSSRRAENKLALHVLNAANGKNHRWLFQKCNY